MRSEPGSLATNADDDGLDHRPATEQPMMRLIETLETSGVMPRDFATVLTLRYNRDFSALEEWMAWDLLRAIYPNKGDQTRMRAWIVRTIDNLTTGAGLC